MIVSRATIQLAERVEPTAVKAFWAMVIEAPLVMVAALTDVPNSMPVTVTSDPTDQVCCAA